MGCESAVPDFQFTLLSIRGLAFLDLRREDAKDNLQEARPNFAPGLFLNHGNSLEWAATHVNLGMYHARQNSREDLNLAVEHDLAALGFFSRELYPNHWASAHNNLGNALRGLAAFEGSSRLDESAEHLLDALKERPKDKVPELWAPTMINLAETYCIQQKNLEAINIIDEVLPVLDQHQLRLQWAMSVMLKAEISTRLRGSSQTAAFRTVVRPLESAIEVLRVFRNPAVVSATETLSVVKAGLLRSGSALSPLGSDRP